MKNAKNTYRFQLEKEPPSHVKPGGSTREASAKQFPISQGIAGVSMRLAPGGMRELHWHANAGEWGYVVTGCVRTTCLHPDGSSYIDTFNPGDVWFFPRGFGHSIQCLGPGESHFILIFDNGYFSEDHTFSISDWLSRTPVDVAAQSLGVSPEFIAKMPKGEVYFAGPGPIPNDLSPYAAPRHDPALLTTHRYPLMAQQPRRTPGGGTQRTVSVDELPISTTMAGSVLEIEPGSMRELHWHPAADEWQYYLEGSAEMAVFLAEGDVVMNEYQKGDVGYVPMGTGHYIKNTGQDLLKVLVGFNNGHYQANDLSAWISTNPIDVLATNLNIPFADAERLPKREHFFIRGR